MSGFRVRYDGHSIAELSAESCAVHIKRMNMDTLLIEIVTTDGASWWGWIGGMNITVSTTEPAKAEELCTPPK